MYEPANVAERINKLLKEKNLQQKDMLMEIRAEQKHYILHAFPRFHG